MTDDYLRIVRLGEDGDPGAGQPFQSGGPAGDSTKPPAGELRLPSGGMSISPSGDLLLASDTFAEVNGKWIFKESNARHAMFLAAQAGRAQVLRELERIAETLCREAWDQTRNGAGRSLSPTEIADLVIKHVGLALRYAKLHQDPDSAAKMDALNAELSSARNEIEMLRQRARLAEETVKALREEKLRAEARRQEQAEKKAQTLFEKGRIRDRQDDQRRRQEARNGDAESKPAGEQSRAGNGAPVAAAAEQPETPKNEERALDVVRFMAATGLSRPKEIRKGVAKQWEITQSSNVQQHIAAATERGWVTGVVFDSDFKGAAKLSLIELTDAGRKKAIELGVTPMRSQLERGMAAHKSVEQTNGVLETADILLERGYTEVNPFPQRVRFGEIDYSPDLTACDPKTGETIFVEYERPGYKNLNVDRRKTKWDRAAQFGAGTVHLVTPDGGTLEAVIGEIRQAGQGAVKVVLAFDISAYRQNTSRAELWVEHRIGSAPEG